jgi:hypothetical protein
VEFVVAEKLAEDGADSKMGHVIMEWGGGGGGGDGGGALCAENELGAENGADDGAGGPEDGADAMEGEAPVEPPPPLPRPNVIRGGGGGNADERGTAPADRGGSGGGMELIFQIRTRTPHVNETMWYRLVMASRKSLVR